MKREDLLTIHQLDVTRGARSVIRDFGLGLQRGDFVGLHGPSGSGKTTLLRAIAGLIDVTVGQVLFNGQTPEAIGWPRFRRKVVYLQQKPTLSDTTVLENLERAFQYVSAEQQACDANRATELLERLHLNHGVFDQKASSLSVGEQQRVCFVRTLLLEPAVLLLDEPTSALDEDAADAVRKLLAEQRDQRGLSAIIAMHNRSRLDELCERTIELKGISVDDQTT